MYNMLYNIGVKKKKNPNARYNSMSAGVQDALFSSAGNNAPVSQSTQLSYDSSGSLLTLQRNLLSNAYRTHGVIQTMIDQPVEDALRGGIDISCDEISAEDIQDFQSYLEENKILSTVKSALRWARLFGGAGIIINTIGDPTEELSMDEVDEDAPLALIVADRWELMLNYYRESTAEIPWTYYGQPIHRSRVVKVMGKEAPAQIRRRLQGWGMSEIERCVRTLNSYNKNQDVAYEIMDEAKIDIFRMEGYNDALMTAGGAQKIANAVELAQKHKNYHRALLMDKLDEYEQKQLSFAGLSEMLNQNRIGAAADVRMPMTKIFGMSAAGFNAGEDDIENYNSIVEGECRSKGREILRAILPICFKQFFGFEPDGLDFAYKSLRVLSAVQEADIKQRKFERYSRMYEQGILSDKEYAELLHNEELIPIETEVGKGLREAIPPVVSYDSKAD